MSIVSINMSNVHEREIVPEGVYDFEVVSCIKKRTKANNRDMIVAVLRITNPPEEIPYSTPVIHYMVLPNDDDMENNPQMSNDWLLEVKRFVRCTNVETDDGGFDTAMATGAVGSCFFTVTEGDDGVIRNQPRFPKVSNT